MIDPYFSATKLAWLLDEVPGCARAPSAARCCFGTVDSFLIWRLTGGAVHATDATNASRTLLFDIRRQRLEPRAAATISAFRAAMLPEVRDSAARLRRRRRRMARRPGADHGRGGRPAGVAHRPGLLRSGHEQEHLRHRLLRDDPYRAQQLQSTQQLLATVAYRLGGVTSYALEGSIFSAASR